MQKFYFWTKHRSKTATIGCVYWLAVHFKSQHARVWERIAFETTFILVNFTVHFFATHNQWINALVRFESRVCTPTSTPNTHKQYIETISRTATNTTLRRKHTYKKLVVGFSLTFQPLHFIHFLCILYDFIWFLLYVLDWTRKNFTIIIIEEMIKTSVSVIGCNWNALFNTWS